MLEIELALWVDRAAVDLLAYYLQIEESGIWDDQTPEGDLYGWGDTALKITELF